MSSKVAELFADWISSVHSTASEFFGLVENLDSQVAGGIVENEKRLRRIAPKLNPEFAPSIADLPRPCSGTRYGPSFRLADWLGGD